MNENNYFLRTSKVAARRIGDEMLIMTAQESAVFSLNETAALLWEAADGRTPLAQIVEREICTRFETDPETALADARQTLQGLAELGIIEASLEPIAAENP